MRVPRQTACVCERHAGIGRGHVSGAHATHRHTRAEPGVGEEGIRDGGTHAMAELPNEGVARGANAAKGAHGEDN